MHCKHLQRVVQATLEQNEGHILRSLKKFEEKNHCKDTITTKGEQEQQITDNMDEDDNNIFKLLQNM